MADGHVDVLFDDLAELLYLAELGIWDAIRLNSSDSGFDSHGYHKYVEELLADFREKVKIAGGVLLESSC